MSEVDDADGNTQQPAPSLPLERGGLALQFAADQRRAEIRWEVRRARGTRVRTIVLLTEIAKRGWTASDLASAARVSPATVSAAVQGRRISARTLRRFAEALHRQPVIPGAEALILAE